MQQLPQAQLPPPLQPLINSILPLPPSIQAAKPSEQIMARGDHSIVLNIAHSTVHVGAGEDLSISSIRWVEGKRLPDHSIYTGGMAGQLPTGQGTKIFDQNYRQNEWLTYNGQFHEGVPHGFGVAKGVDGSTYMGMWERGLRHGKGTLFEGNSTYTGDWTYDKMEGKGTLTRADDTVYIGHFADSKRDGLGLELNPDSSHKGSWRKGVKHGQGTERTVDLGTSKGTWKNNEKDGAHKVWPPLESKRTVIYLNGKNVSPLYLKCFNACCANTCGS